MLDDGPCNVKREDFIEFVKGIFYKKRLVNLVIEALYPKGSKCKIDGLVSNTNLNGKIGICNGIYLKDRLGVDVPELSEKFSIRPKNIKII